MKTAPDLFFVPHEKDEFSTSFHVELGFFFGVRQCNYN